MHTLGSESRSRAGGEANPCCGLSGAHGSSEPGMALQSFSKLKQGGQCLSYPCTSQPLTTSPGRDMTLAEAVPLRTAALYLSTNITSAGGGALVLRGVLVEHPTIHHYVYFSSPSSISLLTYI